MDDMMNHLPHLQAVANEDVAEIRRKEETYRGSWRRGGGVNAWHMARRKYDRLAVMLAPMTDADRDNLRKLSTCQEISRTAHELDINLRDLLARAADAEDIFRAMDADTTGQDGSVLAEVRDLRRYLLLFEARLLALASPEMQGPPRTSETYPTEIIAVAAETSVPAYAVAFVVKIRGKNAYTNSETAELLGTSHIENPDDVRETYRFWGVGVLQVLDAYDRATERLVPRAVPATDSNKHAEHIIHGACANCNGTKVVSIKRQGDTITIVCPVCR